MIKDQKEQRIHVKLSLIFQYALNTALVLLGIVLCFLLGKEIIYFIRYAFLTTAIHNHYQFLERILVFFLYFELTALIVKYFKELYHFPMRYFLYIGITALIRLIVVYHDSPMNTFIFSSSVLVLVISFYMLNLAKEKH
ncbi:phosphate-starvation-inducible protein PsiE [Peribacillus kribbensis]|uniref:phosphate-starvation-inducible protein PsiE n=1 Tax=Peribacillus kribbensis TaxID=356658 RepID=UPI0004072074|nr:phosphate-starvation-inducible protein PsiE [Peribacillus kribbensis]